MPFGPRTSRIQDGPWHCRGGWWTELTDRAQIRAKVAVYIREFKKRVKALGNCQTSESSTFTFGGQDGRKRQFASVGGDESDKVGGKVMRTEHGVTSFFCGS